MKRATMFGVAVVATLGLVSMGCLNDNTLANSGNGGSGGAGSGGASGGSSTSSSSGGSGGGSGGSGGGAGGAGSGGASGGSSTSSSSGGSGGSTTSSGACGTTDGSYKEDTTFGTAESTAPYKLNKWGTWGDGMGTPPALTQTTTGPSGLDCGSGCAMLSIDFSDKTAQYSAGSFVEYFGTASDSVENLLNETITAKIAVGVKQASGTSTSVPISINLFARTPIRAPAVPTTSGPMTWAVPRRSTRLLAGIR